MSVRPVADVQVRGGGAARLPRLAGGDELRSEEGAASSQPADGRGGGRARPRRPGPEVASGPPLRLQFPLTLSFKIVSLASQIYVRDARGRDLLYVHQKLLKLKESITAYADPTKAKVLFGIAADRVLDFRARYDFTDAAGNHLGAMKRQGARSIWRATYDVYLDRGDSAHLRIREERPWVKFLDSLLGEIPIFGILTGLFLNPSYQVVDTATEQLAYRVVKKRALLESRFVVDRHGGAPNGAAERAVLLAILTVTLLERSRG